MVHVPAQWVLTVIPQQYIYIYIYMIYYLFIDIHIEKKKNAQYDDFLHDVLFFKV